MENQCFHLKKCLKENQNPKEIKIKAKNNEIEYGQYGSSEKINKPDKVLGKTY